MAETQKTCPECGAAVEGSHIQIGSGADADRYHDACWHAANERSDDEARELDERGNNLR